ncbi:MAG: tetratricopeptide repeat protein [Anaerolineales bacterium]|nr:tetratricopeptide repeat protein [Anaerolineales bacterium]
MLDLGQTDKEWKDFFKDPRPYGGKLFQTLFKDSSEARKAFDELSKQTERTIILVLESSELDGIAWEYAYHDNAYLVEDFSFIRALPEKERPLSNGRLSKSVERVPLLFIPANPLVDLSGEPMRELDIESEWREMTQHIVKSNAPFDLIELRPATPAALQSVMARFQNGMIAHFSGHGAVTKDGAFLLFENENGSSNPFEAREFVREVKDQAWIGFLSACQSAVAERTEFGNLARELVRAGVPFALGMQFNLPDPFAPNISGQFYNYLSQGHTVPEAARQARRAVKRENEFYVGMIALYAAHPDEAGKMEWSGSGTRTVSTFAVADVSDLPTPSGFIGRQRELMNIGTNLLEKKKPNTVTLHGAGGIGKTALMRQALLRFAPSFEAALAIALDPLPSLESVLGRLERFLNLPSPCSSDTKERERIVRERLTSKRTLLGLDNFETLNYALNEKDSDEEKTAKGLHSLFKYLVANGVTLCVTSREVTNLGGELIIDIEGLPNDVGGRLFQDNVVKPKQKEQIYIEKTQQVSEMVGGHPLALRLLASAFDDQVGTSLDQYIEDLQSHLPKAQDKWTEEDRHESLRASFDFTMKNLVKIDKGEIIQIAFARLSFFSAFFVDLNAVPVIESFPENADKFLQFCPKADQILQILWEHSMLERITIFLPQTNYYLYRLHPTLRLFAKERLTDYETVQENFWKSMNNFARVAEEQSLKNSFVAQVALRAIPDLLTTALSRTNEDAALMQFRTGKLFLQFGLYDDAMQLLEKSLSTNQKANNPKGKSAVFLKMANIFQIRGDMNGAMKLLQQSLTIDEDLGDLEGKSVVLHDMANILNAQGDIGGAMNFYQQSLTIAESLGNLEVKSATLWKIGRILRTRGKLNESMKLYQQALEIAENLGNLQTKSAVQSETAYILRMQGDTDGALKLYEQSLKTTDDLGDLEGKSGVLHDMAYVLQMQGNFTGAMKLHQQSLKINEELGNLYGKAITLTGMANILRSQGSLDEAMELYQQSLELCEGLGNLEVKANVLHEMGYVTLFQGDLDKAMKLFQQSLEITRGMGDLESEVTTLAAISDVYFENEEYSQAKAILEQAMQIEKQIGNIEGCAYTAVKLGKLYQMQGQKDAALAHYHEGLSLFEHLGSTPLIAKTRLLIESLNFD